MEIIDQRICSNYFVGKSLVFLAKHHKFIHPKSESPGSPDSANKLKFFWNKRKWFFCSPLFYLLFFLFSHLFCDFLFFAQFVFRSFSYSLHFRLSFSAHFFFRFSFFLSYRDFPAEHLKPYFLSSREVWSHFWKHKSGAEENLSWSVTNYHRMPLQYWLV